MPELSLLAWPFTAGMVAAFNPCGFAMLPTYLTYFLGLDSDETTLSRSVMRGAKVGAALTLGFVLIFGIFGVLFEVVLSAGARSAVQDALWAVTIGSGLLILVLGAMMLRGFQPVLNLPKTNMGTDSRELGSMFLFGVSYGVVSLGCTIGPFLIAVTNSVSNSDATGGSLWAFVAYALGMGSVIVFLTMAMAAGRAQVANKMRSLLPFINRISGVLLVLAGIFLMMHGWFQRDPLNNSNGVLEFIDGIQADVQNWVSSRGEGFGLVLLAASLLIGAAALIWRRFGSAGGGTENDPPNVEPAA